MGPPSPRRVRTGAGTLPWLNKVTQVGGFGLWLGGEEAEEEKSKEIIIKNWRETDSPLGGPGLEGLAPTGDSFCY